MSSMAYRYGVFLDNLDLNRRHWTIFSVCAAGFLFDAADFQVMARMVEKHYGHLAPNYVADAAFPKVRVG